MDGSQNSEQAIVEFLPICIREDGTIEGSISWRNFERLVVAKEKLRTGWERNLETKLIPSGAYPGDIVTVILHMNMQYYILVLVIHCYSLRSQMGNLIKWKQLIE